MCVNWQIFLINRISTPNGKLEQASGAAYKTSDPGKFTLTLENAPVVGSYWVVALGDIPAGTNKYPWSVVSTPFGTDLFILARDPNQFRTTYQTEVLDLVKAKGFTKSYNKPLETYQAEDCEYAPLSQSNNLRR